MAWLYIQSTGRLFYAGNEVTNDETKGYSGKHPYINMHEAENLRDWGPIPLGRYRIGGAYLHATKGPVTMKLTPDGHIAHHRTDFLIHGDTPAATRNASQGCIILNRDLRTRIANSKDSILDVERVDPTPPSTP